MSNNQNKIIELMHNEWSEVTPPICSKNNSDKPNRFGFRIHLIVGVASAILGFIASDMGQDIDLDIDVEHPGLSTTARIVIDELIKREAIASGVAGFRLSAVHASTIAHHSPKTTNEVAYLGNEFSSIR